MIFPLKNFPVNWIDGMKISKDHFIDSDKHVHDLVRDAASVNITNHNFGLLPSPPNTRDFLDLQVAENNGNLIDLTLNYCSAITSGGFKIHMDLRDSGTQKLRKGIEGINNLSASNNEVSWYEVVLIADPYKRTPIGVPSLEETPPRHPYSEVTYKLEIIPAEQLNTAELGPYYLVIGKIKNKGGYLSVADNFIPPCVSIQAHPGLIDFHNTCIRKIEYIQNISFKIVRKIHEKNKPSSVAKNFLYLCNQTLNYIANTQFSLINEIPEQAPVKLISIMSSLANVVYTSLQCIHPEEKEELLKYIFEWSDVSPNEAEQKLASAINVKYNHYDIYQSVHVITNYLKTLEAIWNKMDTLEFIGQRKENIVVTKQTVQTQEEKPKKRWSILD